MSKKPLGRDFGRKPWFNSEEDYMDYESMMRAPTNFSDPSLALQKHSEFIKPYARDVEYYEFENFKPQNINQPAPFTTDITTGDLCAGALMYGLVNGVRSTPYKLLFGESASLAVGGHDGVGNPWPVSSWHSIVELDGRGVIKGNMYHAPTVSEVTGIDSCFGFDVNLRTVTGCGIVNVIISVEPPEALPLSEISGAGDAAVGGKYVVSGGTKPYSWSISCGQIDQNGTIQDLTGCCGVGTIKVVDVCGEKTTLKVRMPSGTWVVVASCISARGDCYDNSTACFAGFDRDNIYSSGNVLRWKISHHPRGDGCCCVTPSSSWCNVCTVIGIPASIFDCKSLTESGCPADDRVAGYDGKREEWQCP